MLVEYCASVKMGDLVTIVSDLGCISAVEAIFEAMLRAGGHPSFHAKSDALHELVLRQSAPAIRRPETPTNPASTGTS